jgi:hypothetical protein
MRQKKLIDSLKSFVQRGEYADPTTVRVLSTFYLLPLKEIKKQSNFGRYKKKRYKSN